MLEGVEVVVTKRVHWSGTGGPSDKTVYAIAEFAPSLRALVAPEKNGEKRPRYVISTASHMNVTVPSIKCLGREIQTAGLRVSAATNGDGQETQRYEAYLPQSPVED